MFGFAAREYAIASTLGLVCRSALDFIIPELYRSVTLSSPSQIFAFQDALVRSQNNRVQQVALFPNRNLPSLVRNLWVGPKTCLSLHGLSYASSSWPIDSIHSIFSMCLGLRSVAMVNLDQSMWFRLESVIPPTVETLYLGPIHGSLSLKSMRCFSNLHSIVSANTYMPDWEVKDIVTSPHCRRFCRFFQWSVHVEFAFKQLECMAQAAGLEDMQIVVFGHGDFERKVGRMVRDHSQFLKDKRISVVCRPSSDSDWMESLYSQWTSEA